MSAARFLLFGLVILTGALTSHGFVLNTDANGNDLRWELSPPDTRIHVDVVNRQTGAIRYYIGADTYSLANREAELNSIRAAFDQWQAIPGAAITFEEAGLLSGAVDVNTADNKNLIFWVNNGTLVAGGTADIRGATAFTFFDIFTDNTMAEADIVLNGSQFAWYTDFSNPLQNQYFVEAVVLHEIGHLIGIDHSPVGAATMVARGSSGANLQAGLSADDIHAAQTLYPAASTPSQTGGIRGRVTLNGAPLFGGVVSVEDLSGNMRQATLTGADGRYRLRSLPPGSYQLRVTPLDAHASSSTQYLLRGRDIDADYAGAQTAFLPSDPVGASVAAGQEIEVNLQVNSGTAFRITRLGRPSGFPTTFAVVNSAVQVLPGQDGLYLGIYGPDLPTSGANVSISGTGVTLGEPIYRENSVADLNLISVPISVSGRIAIGLRTVTVEKNGMIAHANGFFEIAPLVPDFNFDFFDDRFQRAYFGRFTAPEAGSNADPDDDGFSNQYEFSTGTDPTDQTSVYFKVLSVTLNSSGALVKWDSAPGKRYQLYGRRDFPNSPWGKVGSPVLAAGSTTSLLDTTANGDRKFYRVEAVFP